MVGEYYTLPFGVDDDLPLADLSAGGMVEAVEQFMSSGPFTRCLVFRVVDLAPELKKVVGGGGSVAQRSGHICPITIQRYEVLSPSNDGGIAYPAVAYDIVETGSLERVDALTLGPWNVVMNMMHRWKMGKGDKEGSLRLTDASKAKPSMAPTCSTALGMLMVSTLAELGWKGSASRTGAT